MPITQLNNGASTATARAKINTIIDQLNGPSSPSQTPNVWHVNSLGNDTTGTGTMAQPFETLGRAVTAAGGNDCTFYLGRGTYAVTRSGWPANQVIIGQGWGATIIEITSADAVYLTAHDCDVSIITDAAPGAIGADGNSGDPNGQYGGAGGNAPPITLKGSCRGLNISALGGAGGAGGNAISIDDAPASGGYGGNGGESGAIIIQVPVVLGSIINGSAFGGFAGSGANGGSTGVDGASGGAASLTIDACDFHESGNVNTGPITVSRSYYPPGVTITNNLGGNATS